MTEHAPGGVADIELFNDDVHIAVETTKLLRVAQTNNEATPVPAHLDDLAGRYPAKKCFALFVSPRTFARTVRLFHLYNRDRAAADHLRIAAVDFTAFNLLTEYLQSEEGNSLTVAQFLGLVRGVAPLADDDEVLSGLTSLTSTPVSSVPKSTECNGSSLVRSTANSTPSLTASTMISARSPRPVRQSVPRTLKARLPQDVRRAGRPPGRAKLAKSSRIASPGSTSMKSDNANAAVPAPPSTRSPRSSKRSVRSSSPRNSLPSETIAIEPAKNEGTTSTQLSSG